MAAWLISSLTGQVDNPMPYDISPYSPIKFTNRGLGYLMPLSTIFQLYHGGQIYW